MIKSEFIIKLSKYMTHLPEEDVILSVNHLLEVMSDTLGEGGRIEIRGFGSFALQYCPARKAHNPRTGKKLKTAPKYKTCFKAGKDLKEQVDKAHQARLAKLKQIQ